MSGQLKARHEHLDACSPTARARAPLPLRLAERSARSVVVSRWALDRVPGLQVPRRRPGARCRCMALAWQAGRPLVAACAVPGYLRPQLLRRSARARVRVGGGRRRASTRRAARRNGRGGRRAGRPVQQHQRRMGNRSASWSATSTCRPTTKLLEWPATNGMSPRRSTRSDPDGPLVFRESQTWGEDYASFIAPSVT